jgi:hypothetical protein
MKFPITVLEKFRVEKTANMIEQISSDIKDTFFEKNVIFDKAVDKSPTNDKDMNKKAAAKCGGGGGGESPLDKAMEKELKKQFMEKTDVKESSCQKAAKAIVKEIMKDVPQ